MPPALRVLILVNLVLGGALVLAWRASPVAWDVPAARVPDADSLQAVTIARAAPQADAFAAMLERPLFDPERRRGEVVAHAAAPSTDPFSDATLLGLVYAEQGASAIVHIDGAVRRVRPGERIGPWTLAGVSEGTARFVGDGGQTWVLALQRARQPAGTAPPSTTGAVPGLPAASVGQPAQAGAADRGATPAAEDPIASKSFEERVAERRARRERMQQRLER